MIMKKLDLMNKWYVENNFEIFSTNYPAETNLKGNFKEIKKSRQSLLFKH